MAGTLYLLIGTTVMTASAFISNQSQNHYKNREILEISADPYDQYLENRQGEINNESDIVFPGPTSEPLQLEIPEDCKKLGFCEHIGNYPYEEVRKAIEKHEDLIKFQKDKLDKEESTEITQRIGPRNENEELCDLVSKVVYPQAAVDENNTWHIVLNQEKKFIQGYRVEICNVDASPCRDLVFFDPPVYQSRCKQKFAYRTMETLHKGEMIKKELKVPICCSCVVKQIKK